MKQHQNQTRLSTAEKAGAAATITAAGLLCISLVGGFEGLRLYAYQDVIGVWTACYGETKGIKKGMRFTKDQCNVMFLESLTRHEKGMRTCLNDPDSLPDKVYVTFLSLTYNVGVGGFCRSSVARHANNLNLRSACNSLLAFNKAGGRVVRGLVVRRQKEHKICLEGLKGPIARVVVQTTPEVTPAKVTPPPPPAKVTPPPPPAKVTPLPPAKVTIQKEPPPPSALTESTASPPGPNCTWDRVKNVMGLCESCEGTCVLVDEDSTCSVACEDAPPKPWYHWLWPW